MTTTDPDAGGGMAPLNVLSRKTPYAVDYKGLPKLDLTLWLRCLIM